MLVYAIMLQICYDESLHKTQALTLHDEQESESVFDGMTINQNRKACVCIRIRRLSRNGRLTCRIERTRAEAGSIENVIRVSR